ncbi:MAG: hypothetical protein LIR50_05640 [Bacillota bacterium]|nr:hypothetical protein [Bacillota bacterium]
MSNTISFAEILQKGLDKAMVAAATSGWMEANAGQVIYNGGNTIKIPKLSMDGLGEYGRTDGTGYTNGNVNFGYETKTMTQDRSRAFTFDAMDVDETNFELNAPVVLSEFQRTKVVPELDAYRYSSLATQFITAERVSYGYTPTASTIMATLKTQIDDVKDAVGDVELVCSISRTALSMLEQGTRLEKVLFNNGVIETEVSSIDGVALLPVPSARMKTAYTLYDGKTAGQEVGGFVAAETAKTVNWLIMPRTVPIAISKQDVPRIFDPTVNQNADAWKVTYRKYHDIWVMDNKLASCFVSIKEAQA